MHLLNLIKVRTQGAFFWGYSGIGILQIYGNRVLWDQFGRFIVLGMGISCILLFVNRNKNNGNSPKRMRSK